MKTGQGSRSCTHCGFRGQWDEPCSCVSWYADEPTHYSPPYFYCATCKRQTNGSPQWMEKANPQSTLESWPAGYCPQCSPPNK